MDRSEDIALFRYGLIRAAADEGLTKATRGLVVRALAAQSHTGPSGQEVQVSRQTIDRWVRAYRKGGFSALRPGPRRVEPRTPPEALELACRLRKEDPARSGAHIAEVLRAAQGWSPHPRTLERHFKALGLTGPPSAVPTSLSGASRPTTPTSCGPATPCTARSSRAKRRSCSRS